VPSLAPLLSLLFASFVVAALVLWLRLTDQRSRDAARTRFQLRFPKDLVADQVEAFLRAIGGMPMGRHLHTGESTIVFDLVAEANAVRHFIRVPEGQSPYVLSQLRALVPRVRITEVQEQTPAVDWATELRLTDSGRELRADVPAAVASSLIASSQPLTNGEAVVLQWVVAPSITGPVTAEGTAVIAARGLWRQLASGKTKPDPEVLKAAREKVSAPLFRAVGHVGVAARTPERGGHLMWRMIGVLHSLRKPGVSLKERLLPNRTVARRLTNASTPVLSFPCRLNAREMACVIAWPIEGPEIVGLPLGGSRDLLADPAIPSVGRVIGEATFPGGERPIGLSERDSTHHVVITGPTGTGKSTLLANLILGDIAAGRGVIAIDPKGDLVADVLDRIPLEQADRVVLLDPTDDERPVGLNLLVGAHEAPELVTDQVLAIFHQMYASYWGVRIQDVLHSSLFTLAVEPGLTLCELPLLLVNDAFRRRLVSRLDDPIGLKPFWAWYEQLKPGEKAQALGPVLSRLRPLLLRRRIRDVIGQAEPTFTMGQVLAEPKVLLVSLAEGLLGPEAASLIGSLVIAQLWQAIQGRAALPASARRPVFVYADEFQEYVALPTDIADVMARARGYAVSLHLAHQHLGQLPPELRQSVAANARSRIAFQSAADDAAVLARQLGGGLTPNDLQDLEAFEVYASLYAGGRVRSPVSARTFPLPSGLGTAGEIRSRSRLRYGRERSDVEAAIQARHQVPLDDGPVGRARRQR
jgi:hypothetical protein